MGNIKKMSLHLANMIAAGEVVERPSSVVKELVENSIDAKATSIKIFLENGGLDLIKVVDDGIGMDRDDVVMAFLPHATSKIKTEYDLARISTLGFRGEAIASIASVSTTQIISSMDGISGYECTYKSGVILHEGITNSNKGTTVSVDSLFFNTPARLKYMKTPKSELSSIMFWVERIAIAHPELRFTVISDGKQIFQTSGSKNYKNLIAEIYGIDAAKNYMEHSYVCDGYKTTLVLIKPQIYRASKLEITMVCNGRYVKNYNITNAVIDGFQTYLPIGKCPIAIMYFDVDPILIDVNVHPRKTEIKISNEEEICKKLTLEIRNCLLENTHIPTRVVNHNPNVAYEKINVFDFKEEKAEDENKSHVDNSLKNENKENNVLKDEDVRYTHSSTIELDKEINDSFAPVCDGLEAYSYQKEEMNFSKNFVNNDTISANEDISTNKSDDVIKEEKKKLPFMEYIGQVFGTYLIFQSEDGLYLMDQHAAAERVNYEKYYALLSNPKQPKTELLIPEVLTFTAKEALYIEENLTKFSDIGFVLESIGSCDFVVREIPLWCKLDNIDGVIYDVLSLMVERKKIDISYFRDEIAKQISCKASIRANKRINRDEIDALICNLNKCQNPYTCPHGRPTIINLKITDIEKMFERIQK